MEQTKRDAGYACFGGAGNQFRMTGIYATATEAQLFCRRSWIVRPVSAEEVANARVSSEPLPHFKLPHHPAD